MSAAMIVPYALLVGAVRGRPPREGNVPGCDARPDAALHVPGDDPSTGGVRTGSRRARQPGQPRFLRAPRKDLREVQPERREPVTRLFAGRVPPFALVKHRGRVSGRGYATPVLAFATRDGLVFALLYGRVSDWALNVLAADGASVKRHGGTDEYGQPRLIPGNDRLRLLPAPLRPPLRLFRVRDFLSVSLLPQGTQKAREPTSPHRAGALDTMGRDTAASRRSEPQLGDCRRGRSHFVSSKRGDRCGVGFVSPRCRMSREHPSVGPVGWSVGRVVRRGRRRIRTSVGYAGDFTDRSLWPLGHPPGAPRIARASAARRAIRSTPPDRSPLLYSRHPPDTRSRSNRSPRSRHRYSS